MKSGNTRGVIVLINEHLKLFTLFFHITQVKTSFENCSGSSYILREHQFRQLFDCILKLYRLFFHVQKGIIQAVSSCQKKKHFGKYSDCFCVRGSLSSVIVQAVPSYQWKSSFRNRYLHSWLLSLIVTSSLTWTQDVCLEFEVNESIIFRDVMGSGLFFL